MSDYRQMLEDGFAFINELDGQSTRLSFLGDYIFDFTTYDSEWSEIFAKRAIEVCESISNKTTFESFEEPGRYRWFLIMINMPFFSQRINWGTSVRGAWWESPPDLVYQSSGLFIGDEQFCSHMFTTKQWCEFIAAIIEFGRAQ